MNPISTHGPLDMGSGQPAVVEEIYAQLRGIAQQILGGWAPQRSLQPTLLVHEAWLRLAPQRNFAELGKAAFIQAAALSIRRILVEHYRKHQTLKQGGHHQRVPLFESIALDSGEVLDFAVLDSALEDLARIDPRQAQVVEMRFFGGCGEQEIADALNVSRRTVAGDWRHARAWLTGRLKHELGA